MRVVEMFSGIGSQAKALKRVSNKLKFNFEIVNTCEWEIHAIVAYHYIHNNSPISDIVQNMDRKSLIDELSKYPLSTNGKELINQKYLGSLDEKLLKLIYHAIIDNNNLIDIKKVKGSQIPNDIDLLTYSFPCQDLSNVGSFHGYKHGIDRDKNTRSGLLWEVERILEEKRSLGQELPKYLLLENVTALEAARHKGNFQQWQEKLTELGYINRVYKLNSEDFGIPQYRKRLIMLSVYVGDSENKRSQLNEFWTNNDLNSNLYIESLKLKKIGLEDVLKLDYENITYYKEALEAQPNNTSSRRKIWNSNSKIVDEQYRIASKVQTITTKQDRHPNSGNIFFDINNGKSKYRFLTPRECFILMGFDESDYELLIDNNITTRGKSVFFSRDILYKLAGNSIVVNILEQVFSQIVRIESEIFNKNNFVIDEKRSEPFNQL